MMNAEWGGKRVLADDADVEGPDERQAPSPPSHENEREGALPGALVPPPFEEDEPPFTD